MSASQTLTAYAALFAELSPGNLDRLDALCRPDIRFRDPFHDVEGLPAMRAILAAMFETLDDPRFVVIDHGMGASEGFIHWRFDAGMARGRRLAFEGTSTVAFDGEGRIASHTDHWDAAEAIHGKLPLLGPLVRLVNARISAAGRR